MLPTTPVAWVALVATLLSAMLSFGIGVAAHRREPEAPHVRGYARYAFASGVWALAYCGVLLSPPGPLPFAFDTLRAVTAVSAVWGFLLFVANYTGNRERLARPLSVAFAVDVVAYGATYATQPVHGRLFARNDPVVVDGLTVLAQEPTALFLAHFAVIVGSVVAGTGLLLRYALDARNVFRGQTLAVLGGALVTVVVGTAVSLNVAGNGTWQHFDPTPLTLTVNTVVVGWALLRLDYLKIGPLAANTLLAEMTDAVFVLDEDGVVADANRTAQALVEDDVVGAPLEASLPGTAAAMNGGGPVELPAPADTDQPRFYDVNVTPLRGPYDERRGSLVVFRDVSGRVQREHELERRNEQLDEFASLVSHDLRNPLGVAMGYADIAVESGDTEHVREVQASLERMDELVEDLLTLARGDRGAVDAAPMSLADCAKAAWETVETDGATVVVDVDAVVSADRSRVRQAFENLFRNAVEHGAVASADGGEQPAATGVGALTVTVGSLSGGEGFFVADDGAGIPEGERDAVLDSGYTNSDDGTGYGLAIVQSVADAHGWSVQVVEADAGGARFEFRGVEFVD